MVDNWVHKSAMMKCQTCMWFMAKECLQETGKPNTIKALKGRCRRRAPTLDGWPVVFPEDWCGDHKLE
jgi:hypothetical protein